MRFLANGYWSPKEIALRLYGSVLISSSSPGIITGILSKLKAMGLIERIPLWKTRRARYYYRHRSCLASLLYWLDERFESESYPLTKIENVLYDKLGIEVQFFICELLAKSKGLKRAYSILPSKIGDIDIILIDRKGRPIEGFEVKIGYISKSEVRRLIDRIRSLGIPKVGLISLVEKPSQLLGVDEILGPDELLMEARKLRSIEWSNL